MDYCPEIALLHGAFACVQAEGKGGKYDLFHHTKGDKSTRPYLLMRDVVREIISGPEVPRSQEGRRKWSRHLHRVLFCKAFVLNKQFESGGSDVDPCSRVEMSVKASCLPLPDFHPHFFFELSDEFQWTDFLQELLAVSGLSTALTFTSHSLAFCGPDPVLLYDLHLISTALDFLLSVVFSETVHSTQADDQSAESTDLQNQDLTSTDRGHRSLFTTSVMSQREFEDLEKTCLVAAVQSQRRRNGGGEEMDHAEQHKGLLSDLDKKTGEQTAEATNQIMLDKILEQVDQKIHDQVTHIADLVVEALTLVQKRMSIKLFDRSSCKSGAMTAVLPVLGHILACVVAFCVLSLFDKSSHQARMCMKRWVLKDEDEQPDAGLDAGCGSSQNSSETESPLCDEDKHVNLVAEAFLKLLRTSRTRAVCMKCLSSFFAGQTTKGKSAQKLSSEKSVKFGRVLKLNLQLCRLAKPVKVIRVMQTFSEQLASEEDDASEDLRNCVSSMMTELQKREKVAEEKRRNPSLAEVIQKVQKRLPRWDWYLQYGLAKRDLKDWWFAGFLEFLHQEPSVLSRGQDLRQLLAVIQQMSLTGQESRQRALCAELISKAFTQLPSTTQERILLETYRDEQWPGFQPRPDYERALTVAFNKLSATTAHQGLCAVLPLALHDLLTFTHHAVSTAVSSEGQIPVVVKVLQLIPEVMRSVHPLHHPHHALLSHCLHTVLQNHPLDAREQKNCLSLVSLLVKPVQIHTSQQPPLLSPAPFLSSSVLPFITLHTLNPLVSPDFALRLLIGCLEATRCVGFSDWLQEAHPAVVVGCCGGILQECVGMVGKDREVERALMIKSLVLNVLDEMLKHFSGAGIMLEGEGVSWLQKRCPDYDWTVCAYLAPFLTPSHSLDSNPLVAGYAAETMKTAADNPSALLLLCSVSEAASSQVTQALQDHLHIPHSALLLALSQVLPHLLLGEVHRVVQLLTALLGSGCVHMDPHHHSLLGGSLADLPESGVEMGVCQLLTEAVVVMVCQEPGFSDPLLHHLSQLLVAALQALACSQYSDRGKESSQRSLKLVMFHQVCAVMSVCRDVMLDPLFVLLLDLLSAIFPQDSCSQDPEPSGDLYNMLVHGIALIPRQSLQSTLLKKLNCQREGESVE